jgi:hypothetical protein
MPRSLLLPLIAAFALAACSKQADTGAAPAPETAEATDDAAAPADTTAAVIDDTAAVETTVPADEPMLDDTLPAEEPMADETYEDAVDSTTVPADDTTWPSDSAAAE